MRTPSFVKKPSKSFFVLLLAIASITTLQGAETSHEIATHLTIFETTTLGIVEGLTEYIPVSSVGHMIITTQLLGLDDEPQKNLSTNLPSLGYAAAAYGIVLQAGAILAVLFFYRKRVLSILLGFLGKNPAGFHLGLKLLVAFCPAATVGILIGKWIESRFFSPTWIAFFLTAGSFAIFWIERSYPLDKQKKGIDSLTIKDAFFIGSLQCLSLFPGVSRSLTTILGGLLKGFSRREATAFSFLLGFVTLSAASLYKLWNSSSTFLEVIPVFSFVTGFVAATAIAFITMKWAIWYLGSHSLKLFAYYRLALALLILIFVYHQKI